MMSMYVVDGEEKEMWGCSYAVERGITGDMTAVRTRLMGGGLCCHLGPQHRPHLGVAETCEGVSPVEP